MEPDVWQVAEAKNKFSELLNRTDTEGPQRVTRRGRTYVVLSETEYERLAGRPAKKMSLGEYLLTAPKVEGLVIERDRSEGREIDFGPDEE
jgi:prevent-host-death family protein